MSIDKYKIKKAPFEVLFLLDLLKVISFCYFLMLLLMSFLPAKM